MDLEDMFYISEKDWYELQIWATIAHDKDKNEISGLMTAVPQKDGRFKLGDVAILEQENSGSNTELDGEAVTNYTMKYGMKYKNPEMKFVWWHSHHTMGAFWSGTDEKEINACENESFSLALVVNLKEEYVFRVSVWKANGIPIEKHFDTNLTIERKKPMINITDRHIKEYKELCSNKTHIVKPNGYIGYNRQNTLFQNREANLNIERYYRDAEEKVEKCMDGLTDGSMSLTKYKLYIKGINNICKQKNLPFKIKILKGDRESIMNEIMETMTGEMFEWTDETLKDQLEQSGWYGGGWYGN